MPRQPRKIQEGYCYHITTRCNNREFHLNRRECRCQVLENLEVQEVAKNFVAANTYACQNT